MPADGGHDLKEVLQGLGSAFEEFKKTNDARIKELQARGDSATSETLVKLDRIDKELTVLGDLKSRLEKAEIKLDRPGNPAADTKGNVETQAECEYREAFFDWIRFGKQNPDVANAMKSSGIKLAQEVRAKHAAFLAKASGSAQVDTLTGADGGYGVPKVISDVITKKLLDISPFRQYCKVVTIGTSDYHELVDKRGENYGWVGETDARSGTRTPALIDVKPPIGTIYAYPKATEESLQDIFFDVQAWLIGNVTNAFDQGEGIAFATGDGTNKPLGFLNSLSSIDDGWGVSPQRADFAVQYVPTGKATGFPNDQATSPKGNPADVLFDCVMKMKPAYRARGRWSMNKQTTATVRKWKDGFGNYLWTPGLAANQPNMLLGYDVIEAEAMPAIATNAYPIVFADWMEAYLVVDRAGIRMTYDEITTPGYVKFYTRKRVGGKVLNSDAIKAIKCATS